MYDEPEPMREIHEIRAQMAKEFEGMTIREICQMVEERTREPIARIYESKNTLTVNETGNSSAAEE